MKEEVFYEKQNLNFLKTTVRVINKNSELFKSFEDLGENPEIMLDKKAKDAFLSAVLQIQELNEQYLKLCLEHKKYAESSIQIKTKLP